MASKLPERLTFGTHIFITSKINVIYADPNKPGEVIVVTDSGDQSILYGEDASYIWNLFADKDWRDQPDDEKE